MNSLARKIVLFYVGFSTYIMIEVMFHSKMSLFEPGWSYIASGLMGATAFMIIDSFNNSISWDIEFIIQMVLGGVVVTFIEFIVGLVSVFIFHSRMWDYSDMPMNLYGIICPQFTIFWILLSAIAIILGDIINFFIFQEGPHPYYIFFGKKIYLFKLK